MLQALQAATRGIGGAFTAGGTAVNNADRSLETALGKPIDVSGIQSALKSFDPNKGGSSKAAKTADKLTVDGQPGIRTSTG